MRQHSWVALSREKHAPVAHRRPMGTAFEGQRCDHALAWTQDPIRWKEAKVRIAAGCYPAGVLHPDPISETPDYDQDMCVHDRRALVRDPDNVLTVPAKVVGCYPRNVQLCGHVEELDTHVT